LRLAPHDEAAQQFLSRVHRALRRVQRQAYGDRDIGRTIAIGRLLIDAPCADPEIWSVHAKALTAARLHAEALPAWQRLTELAPDRTEAWVGLGRAHLECADHAGAIRCSQEALTREPANIKARELADRAAKARAA
jgi:tetratricopeptide (TPR) repeat protein